MYDEHDHLIEGKLGEGIFPPDFVKAWTADLAEGVWRHTLGMALRKCYGNRL